MRKSFHRMYSSQLTFIRWLIQLLTKGYDTRLEDEDVLSNPIWENSGKLNARISKNWKETLSKKEGSEKPLLQAILKSFQLILFICTAVRLIDTCFLLALERVFLGRILERLVQEVPVLTENYEKDGYEFKVAIVGFATLSLSRSLLGNAYYYVLEGVGRKIRIGLTSMAHSKLLRLSQKSAREVGAGDLINLISNDGPKLENSYEILTVFIGPFQLCSLTWIVWTHFGMSSIFGLVTILILAAGQSYMGKIGSRFRAKVASASSRRVKLLTQVVTAMRTIKMYAWEKPFSKLVNDARRKELDLIRRSHVLRTIGWCLYNCTSTLAIFSTIIVFLSTGNKLKAEKVFVCSTIYQNIGMILNVDFPKGLAQLGIFLITISRFQNFLLLDELSPTPFRNSDSNLRQNKKTKSSVSVRNVSAKLGDCLILSNMSLELKSPEFIVITGSVGSGKTTLLNVILQELAVCCGNVSVRGRIAYAVQQAWLFRGTIRENILFGKEFVPEQYEKVVHACALAQDLNSFPQGDETIVAEGGISLSGGQKARISLARAVYADSDIYLLDDTLSAVDQEVGQHILTSCINGLLRTKIRVLITSELKSFPESTKAFKIEAGALLPIRPQACASNLYRRQAIRNSNESFEYDSLRISNLKYFDELNGNSPEASRIQSDHVPWSVYIKYFYSGPNSLKYLSIFMVFTLIAFASQAGETYFLKFSVTETGGFNHWSYDAQLTILISVILLVILTSAQHFSSFLRITHINSLRIHDSMFESMLKAPIQFFTGNSAGYVIERFARDTFIVDEVFPFTIFYASHILQKYLASLFLFFAWSRNLFMVFPSIILLFGAYYIQQFQIRSCRSLNRLEIAAREPIVSHINSTFHGLTSIRAFKKEAEIEFRFKRFLDSYFWINYTKLSAICLTSSAIDFLSFALVNIFIVLTSLDSGASGLGYGIAPLIALTNAIGWAASQLHIIETQAKSVESIQKIVEVKPEQAAPGKLKLQESLIPPPEEWPWKGKVTFENVSVTYPDGRCVLKTINFTIFPGEKVAIIGRTGAGKSSLVSALFRLPQSSGRVLIDGIDIDTVPLQYLRPRISIIPQDPILFEGTVRTNLDPFGEFPDAALHKALCDASLSHFTNSNEGLDFEVQEGGKNLSVGERQLLCMARTFLRKNKILVLDEATANIDLETSLLIHAKIHKIFSDMTVLTIQHRLTSILENDKILVMEDGEIKEFDKPETLLENPESYLSRHVSEASEVFASRA